jgi:membrane protein DedA with SNARE-associated domain
MTAAMLAGSLADLASQPALLLAAVFVATFILEDAAIIAAGLLAAKGILDPVAAIAVLVLGTSAGDMGLHVAGRRASRWNWVRRQSRQPAVGRALRWIERRWWFALVAARFAPGLRLPVYLASGVVRLPPLRCAVVILLASLVWTPGLFLLSAAGGTVLGEHAARSALAAVVLAGLGGVLLAHRRRVRGVRRSGFGVRGCAEGS